MSPRAACRLATLGFTDVHDYVPGRVDWLARGLPREGEKANERRAGDFARADVVTCALTDPGAEVRERVAASPYGFAFVVSDGGVLLGRLRRAALNSDGAPAAQEVVQPGPSTARADTPATKLLERLRRGDLRTAVLTTAEGVLLGVVRRDDLEMHEEFGPTAAAR